ncbi:CotH kinase family protein [Paenibacillus rhizolycopersici]|uniref:CotH kinase family protein n=1 Tax=Paenibacillus rhizolycopersici TaxID=2780073 RepID=UPI001EF4696C|nr:CotH kinase family protein [Paenibacillus rhizolycopersici]
MIRKGTRLLLWTCVGLLFVGLIACEAIQSGGPRADGQTDTAEERVVSAEEKKLDEEVFPKDRVVDVKITIDEADFQDMLDNASAEEYKTASVDYNGQHFDNVGIRTKGNLSLRSVVQMTDSDRYSFKLSFDEYVNQTLDGIQKINLNNNYSDASYMREFLTYELAEQMGLPTPKYSYVNVYVNDELRGFYLAVEQISDAYLERHFGNAYGALYKGEMTGSGSDLTWLGEDPAAYTGLALKSETTNGDILIDMLDELNNGNDVEKYIDVPDALGYIALNVLTNNMDSYLGSNKQNYYLYEDDGVFSILPWDYNMAFGGMGGGMGMGFGGGFGRGVANDGAGESGADAAADASGADAAPAGGDAAGSAAGGSAAPDDPVEGGAAPAASIGQASLLIDEPTQGALSERPLVAKLLAVEDYKTQYHEMLQQAIDGYLADGSFSARVAELSELISPYVKADPTAFYTYDEYEQAVPQLLSTNAGQVESIRQQLDGTIASSGDGSGSGGGMGEWRNARAAAGGAADGPPALPEGFQPPEGFPGDAGAPGDAAGGAGQARPMGGGRTQGGGFPGGGPGFGAAATAADSGANEALFTGISLLVLLGAAGFVAFFRRKRL